ncbi:hypothetical protein AMJ39_04180 [candidate division TA06 bacterium DG_24]|uniref:PilZ domain-containing protein n=2 Tax=Bacteria division TA06 TaxID=1156500 RepID=A0A0S8GCW1_UNCT6|nr:MAG: hypothetical protein AMJ39_04180 [candidate division TA06 bacterium DG_24]KPK70560.1 MAG: hypothetical protein AMJ82_02850 [candidate division TA06 bacterium SM23_40]
MSQRGSKPIRDRRAHRRAAVEVPVKMGGIEEELAEGALMTQTCNISSGGAYCRVSTYVAPLTKLGVTMLIPIRTRRGRKKTEVIRCEAIVVRTEPEEPRPGQEEYRCALSFMNLRSTDRAKIDTYVEQQLSAKNAKEKARQRSTERG